MAKGVSGQNAALGVNKWVSNRVRCLLPGTTRLARPRSVLLFSAKSHLRIDIDVSISGLLMNPPYSSQTQKTPIDNLQRCLWIS